MPTDPPQQERRERQDRQDRQDRRRRGGIAFVELVRLAVVVLATAASFSLGSALETDGEVDSLRLPVTLVGAGIGYVAGGVLGRFALGRIDVVERRLRAVSAGTLVAGAFGGMAGLMLGFGLVWPVALFGAREFTLPLAALLVVVSTGAGWRLGASRGGDLLRFVGASGRLPSLTSGSGPNFKLVDTSALIDGRVLDVSRRGFLEGTLVVPTFVLYELQGLADAGDEERRRRGKRGLETLRALQRSAGVAVDVSDDDPAEVDTVDAKLVSLARRRQASLLTCDGNLAQVAEMQGVKVLDLHQLADDLRPPVLPGDTVEVRVVKAGRERGQGVGYLDDGTMVVIEGARDRQGSGVTAEVTSILSNPNGRMVFASLREPATSARLVSGGG